MHKYGGTSSTFVFRLNLMYQCIKHDTDNMSTATLGDKTNISRRCWIFNVICRGSFCMFNDLRRGVLADFVDIGGIVDITVYTFLHNTGKDITYNNHVMTYRYCYAKDITYNNNVMTYRL